MFRQIAVRTLVIALTAIPLVGNAASFHLISGDKVVRQKTISLTIKNGSSDARSLRVGAKTMTLQPSESMKMDAVVGSSVVAVGDQGKHKDGDVIFTVAQGLNGAVCTIS